MAYRIHIKNASLNGLRYGFCADVLTGNCCLERNHSAIDCATADVVTRSNAHAAWAAAVAAIEVVAVAASAYGTVAGYSLFVNKAVFGGVDYGWVSGAVAVIYSGICFADNQYDLTGPQWTEHRTSRCLIAVAVAFIFLVTIGFITGTIAGYSRGLFLASIHSRAPGSIYYAIGSVVHHRPGSQA